MRSRSTACSPRCGATRCSTSGSCRSSTPSPTSPLIAPERRAPDAEGDDGRGPREHFHTFLRSLDVEHEGLPGWYADRLLRALHHYGVTELHQGPQLEAALLRLFISQQRQHEQIPVVLALVDDLAAKAPDGDPRLRETLDRLIEATRRRFPVVAAGARAVRHRRFDRPYVERARAEVTAVMRRLAAAVAGHRPEDADRAAVDELVACPLPLVPILAEDRLLSGTDEPGALLEVLTRRYYKIRELAPVTVDAAGVLRTSYERHDRSVHVFAARAREGGLADALAAVARASASVEPPDTAVADVFVPLAGRDPDALSGELAAALAAADLPGSVRRVAIVAADPDAVTEVFTFRRPGDEGVRPYWMAGDGSDAATFEEDVKFRGLHPMIARRVQMWRLENFDIRRLPSSGEVHLFDCVGRENPSDERLVAVAEVRDLTPVRDEERPRGRPAGGRGSARRLLRRHP